MPQINKLSRASQLSLLAVVILLGALFFTVTNALQEQSTAGHASGGTNLLTNPSFENGATGWYLNQFSTAAGSYSIVSSPVEDGAKSAQIKVTTTDPINWHIQFSHDGLPMDSGQTYTVSFWAKASASRQLTAIIQELGGSDTTYAIQIVNLTTSWQHYSFTYKATVTQPSVSLRFEAANSTPTVWIDNVSYSSASVAPTAVPTLRPTAIPTARPTAIPTVRPTATPTPRPTAIPTVRPTAIPTSRPTATPTPIGFPPLTATPFPTAIPTVKPTPRPTAIPQPTATPIPGSTILALTVGLHGIGNGGDSASPNSQGNMNPLHPTRTITADVYNTQNQLVVSQQGTITYDGNSGRFGGTIDLGTNFVTGFYTVKIKTDQYLRVLVPGIQSIQAGQTINLPAVSLVAGDFNGDNAINIVDYNMLIGCYSDLLPPTNCPAGQDVITDITDDGHVNQFDYNLFLRELTNIGGQ